MLLLRVGCSVLGRRSDRGRWRRSGNLRCRRHDDPAAAVSTAEAPGRQTGRVSQVRHSWVLHVDLDQFIAAVEVLRHPELAGKPLIVGGAATRRNGRWCRPHPTRPEVRRRLRDAAAHRRPQGTRRGDPAGRPRGLHRGVRRGDGDPARAAGRHRAGARLGRGVRRRADRRPRSVRPAPAAGRARTDPAALQRRHRRHPRARQGRDRVRQAARRVPAHRRELAGGDGRRPTIELWGVGTKVSRRLAGLGISTVAELAAARPESLVAEFGPRMGPWYAELGRGDGARVVDDTPWVARGHSRETTFQKDLTEPARSRRGPGTCRRSRGRRGRRPPVVGLTLKGVAPFFTKTFTKRWPRRSTGAGAGPVIELVGGASPAGRSGCSACGPR